jgi:hypothetical protein
MKYVSERYEAQLRELADTLCTPERFGDLALQDTVEFEPVFPHGLQLAIPPEHGWTGVGIPERTDGTRPRAV